MVTYATDLMPRKTVASEILENVSRLKERKGEYLVIYDFAGTRSIPRFYDNLSVILRELGGRLIQRSAAYTESSLCAEAIRQLAQRYGAKVQAIEVKRFW